jgi:hypothetical protein
MRQVMMIASKLTRIPHTVISRSDHVLCTMSDGTDVSLEWSRLAAMLGDDLVLVDPTHYETRRVPTDAELAASLRH